MPSQQPLTRRSKHECELEESNPNGHRLHPNGDRADRPGPLAVSPSTAGTAEGSGPCYTVIETQGVNLLVTDKATKKLYYYATDKDVPVGSPMKVRLAGFEPGREGGNQNHFAQPGEHPQERKQVGKPASRHSLE